MDKNSTVNYILAKISLNDIDHIFCDEKKKDSDHIGFVGFEFSQTDEDYILARICADPVDPDESYVVPVAKSDINQMQKEFVRDGHMWINGG